MSVSLTIPVNSTNNPTLVKGSGFSGATAQPSAVGNSGAAGYSENAICRWNVVPYQTFAGTLKVGVVAFHIEGILGVAFSVEGGNWFFCHTPTLNTDSGTVEHWCILNAGDFSDGPIEVRAVVYSNSGIPRVLQGSSYTAANQSLYLFANSGGTYNPASIYCKPSTGSDSNNGQSVGAPVQTIDKALDLVTNGGKVVLLDAGTYNLNVQNTSPRFAFAYNYANWTTLEPGPGLSKSNVTLTGNGRIFINHLRLHNLTVDVHTVNIYEEVGFQAWADTVAFYNSATWTEETGDGPLRSTGNGGTFATDCTCTDMFFGLVGTNLVRNCTFTKMSGDIISRVTLAVNCTITNFKQIVVGSHNDISQYYGTWSNVIVYGVTATDLASTQCIFLDKDQSSSFRDMAFVNFSATMNSANDGNTQFCSAERHIYFKNVTLPNQPMLWRTDFTPDGSGGNVPFSGTNFKLDGCTVDNATYTTLQSPPSGVTATGTVNSGL